MMCRPAKTASVVLIVSLFSSILLAGDPATSSSPTTLQASPTPLATGFVSLTRMHVTTQRRGGEWTADVTSHITLDYVPNTTFIYEAALVDANGNVHTTNRGQPYVASREVSTGDETDTDKYTVTIPLAGLFSSRPPDLFVRARVLDSSNTVVATAPLQQFSRPKD